MDRDETVQQLGRSRFDETFCELLPRLYRRAAMISGDRQAAEDALQDTYVKLAGRPDRLIGHPQPYAYAFTVMLNILRDGWRRNRRQVLSADVERGSWDGGIADLESSLEATQLLGTLTGRQAAIVLLVDVDGLTLDQTAEVLGVHRGTVARTRGRALRKLRGVLARNDDANRGGGW
ncbi:RNA polymerase sigma factor [Actinoplanes sp. NPDC051513]|uniref:RNA polymerase sigma factor n=1 Tax=Actinoplanes sp. NPDC051513 TaxID=3363908 RepID=UPI003793C66F